MKKFFCMLLAFTLCYGPTVPAFAASENQVATEGQVVIDCDEYKATVHNLDNQLIVTVEYADRYEITTRDYDRNTIVTEVFDYSGTLIDTYNTDIPDPNAPVPFDYYQHTFSNYEYDVDTSQRHEVWTCRRNDDYKTKTRYSSSVTEERLLHWKEEVDTINEAEKDLILGLGEAAVSVVINTIQAGQIGAAIAMVGGSLDLVNNIETLDEAYDIADSVFDQL